jgi:conjugative relaxase-like TrwC/TraI family protein
MTSSAAAKSYYRSSDYYATTPGEWLGKGAETLGLKGATSTDQFDSLADNLDPRTGKSLTTYTKAGRRVGLDMTFNSTKSVGIARELAGKDNAGDPRIEEAHREAVKYTMGLVEEDMQGRVRIGGRDDNRVTGNMVAYRVTHRDTRISADDQKPDMSLHDHVFIFNATFDPVEKKWKAAEIGQIKHDAPFYEAIYHSRLASNLKALGYGIRRDAKAFELTGISRETIDKFSRRRQYIQAVAEKLGITNPESKSKLGATTRLGKAKELADDLNGYYVSRLTQQEKQQLGNLQGQVSYQSSDEKAVRYAIGHMFERQSVVDEKRLYETALRHGIGSVTPESVKAEAKRQGVLLKNGQATTKDVLAEEGRIIAFAREGRGTMRPLGLVVQNLAVNTSGKHDNIATLSPEQQAICDHVWNSPDRVILIRGAAGTGKTHTMKATLAGIDRPVAILAPSVDASRGVLRRDGFADADTVAAFLGNQDWQASIKGGVIYVDEAGMLPIKDLSRLVDVAKEQDARIILQGDPKQHKSVSRHGNMFNVLQQFAGLPVAELREIRRQSGRYRDAVAAIESGDTLKGHDIFKDLGWIETVSDDKKLVDDFMKATTAGKSTLVLAPTHVEGDAITAEIRLRLRADGKLGDEKEVDRLIPLNWTNAQKEDVASYDGTEVVQFFKNSGQYKAGDVVSAVDLRLGRCHPEHFAVYTPGKLTVAVGDVIRTTANVMADGHKIDNGSYLTVTGFGKDGIEVVTAIGNKRTITSRHINHGYVATSMGGQGKTVDQVFAAMGSESLPAVKMEQFYVDLSRARHKATIYTDLAADSLREAIQRQDERKSATELMKPVQKNPIQKLLRKARERFKRLREPAVGATRKLTKQREVEHAR